jgi:hypothetical protein
MGGLESLLIPLVIAVVVMIFSNIFKGTEDDKRRRTGQSSERRPRAPADVDRILEEINRRQREAAARRQAGTVPRPPTAAPRVASPPRPIPTVIRVPTPPRQAPVVRRPTAAEVIRGPGRDQPATARRVTRVEMPADLLIPQAELVEDKPRRTRAAAGALPAEDASAPLARTRPPTAALVQLRQILQSGQALRTAVMLQEIFGPPLCRHRRPRR